jgi:RNA polymerase sigma-70 factor (ECF subfamily)
MNDAELLRRIAGGDEAAFLVLYRRHCDAVHRFAWTILKSEADAEEVVQECFLTLSRKAASFRPERSQLRTWLLGVTRNLCYRNRGMFLQEEDAEEPVEAPEIEAALIRMETAEAVRKAVLSLPKAQREAIVLFEFEELTLAETAEVLGIDPNAVKARLYRGREMLRKRLAPQACWNERSV